MNDNRQFDDYIKDQLGGYSPPVNPRIWEQIEAGREKRKPAGFWFTLLHSRNILLLTALLITGVSGALFLINRNTKTAPGETNSKPDAAINNTASNKQNTGNSNVNTTIPSGTALSAPLNTASADLSPAATGQNHSPSHTGGYTISGTRNILTSASNKTKRSNGATAIQSTAGSLGSDEEEVSEIPGFADILTGDRAFNKLNIYGQRIEATKTVTDKDFIHLKLVNPLPGCPTMEKNSSGNKKYFEFYAGPDYAFRSLKDTGNSVYLQKRKESTAFTSAYSAGIRYTRVFRNGVSIRLGANYSQINEKFTYKQGNLVQVTYIINANGDTTGSYITTGTRVKTTHNKYHSIDIPLTVGYEMGNGRLHANFNAGAVMNIYSWQKGELLDTTYQPVVITTGKGSSPYQFKTNAGLGFVGSVSIYYKVNDRIHIMAEPYYRHNFSQMNKENLTIKQKYNTAGLRVGVRIDLH